MNKKYPWLIHLLMRFFKGNPAVVIIPDLETDGIFKLSVTFMLTDCKK